MKRYLNLSKVCQRSQDKGNNPKDHNECAPSTVSRDYFVSQTQYNVDRNTEAHRNKRLLLRGSGCLLLKGRGKSDQTRGALCSTHCRYLARHFGGTRSHAFARQSCNQLYPVAGICNESPLTANAKKKVFLTYFIIKSLLGLLLHATQDKHKHNVSRSVNDFLFFSEQIDFFASHTSQSGQSTPRTYVKQKLCCGDRSKSNKFFPPREDYKGHVEIHSARQLYWCRFWLLYMQCT